MGDVLVSFWALVVLMAVGLALVKTNSVSANADRALSRLVFNAMLPALMFKSVSNTTPSEVFSVAAVANIGAEVIIFVLYYVLAIRAFRLRGGEETIGALSASYVNAGNIGVPYLVAILGDPTQAVPIMLFQLLVMVPITFTMLDRQTGRNLSSPLKQVASAFKQPPVVGVLIGLAVSLADVSVPRAVTVPVEMLAGATVPIIMIAMGISWGSAQMPKLDKGVIPTLTAVAMRCLLGPLLAVGLGLLFGIEGNLLLAVAIVGAFPSANNVFVYAHRYDVGIPLARESVLLSTAVSMPVVLLIAWIFHVTALA